MTKERWNAELGPQDMLSDQKVFVVNTYKSCDTQVLKGEVSYMLQPVCKKNSCYLIQY